VKEDNGQLTTLTDPKSFNVKPLRKGALEGASHDDYLAFVKEMEQTQSQLAAANYMLEHALEKVNAMQTAAMRSSEDGSELYASLYDTEQKLLDIQEQVEGNPAKNEVGEKNVPDVASRFYFAYRGTRSLYGPTALHQQSLELAQSGLADLMEQLKTIVEEHLPKLEEQLSDLGAPWIEGQPIPRN
jgi:hypothetical protein